MSHDQRRRSDRINVALPVRWIRGKRVVELTANDMNLHGMFLRTDEETMPGALMKLEVELPGGTIALFGTARFVGTTMNGRGIGVEIYLLEDSARATWVACYRAELQRSMRRAAVS